MTPLEIVLSLAWFPWFVIAMIQQRKIKRLEKRIKDQPIGRIVKAELTEEGLMMTGQIFSPEVWDKMAGDLEGMSIGYEPDRAPTVSPIIKKGYW